MKIISKLCAGYVSIVKKYPNGLGNRMERFDQWAKTWNDPHVSTYYDYYHNNETEKHDTFFPDSEAARIQFAQVASRHRPQIVQLNKKITIREDYFVDDHLLSVNPSELQLKKFIKEGISTETRTDVHRMAFWFCVAAVLLSISFYRGVWTKDYKPDIAYLEPHESHYRYNPNLLEKEVTAFIEKINIINQHSKEELQEAKARAIARRQKRQIEAQNRKRK